MRYVLSLLIGVMSLFTVKAQTVQWAVRPTSAQIENYGNLLKVKKDGKCGLIDHNNQEVVPVMYDSISPFRDGFAITLNKVNNQLKIEGVLSEGDYELMQVSTPVYATNYMWFSEGKMPVKGEDGWGYLDTDGNIVIPCQYQIAYPFSEGFASVKIDNKTYYINRNMNYLPVEVGYGELVFGSTFSGQEAIVYSGYSLTPKGYVINKKGKVLRKIKEKLNELKVNKYDHSVGNRAQQYKDQVQLLDVDSRYDVFQENGLYGYKKDGVVVLPAQLDKAEPVRGEFANVQYKGKDGVLHIVDGSFSAQLDNRKIDVFGKDVERGFLVVDVPEALIDAPFQLVMVDENGDKMLVNSLTTQGEKRSFSFLPAKVPSKSGTVNYSMELWSENLMLWKDKGSVDYVVSKPVSIGETVKVKVESAKTDRKLSIASFTISAPKAKGKFADPNFIFYVNVVVKNTGEKSGNAVVSLKVDGKQMGKPQSINVRGHGSTASVQLPVATNVKKERYAKVQAILSDGKGSQEVNIHVMPPRIH